METSLIGDMLGRYVNGDAGYIALITFFICEALFNALPYERARMKQLTSVLVGGALGFFLLRNAAPLDNILQGILAGGALTIGVAKFKKPSAAVSAETVVVAPTPAPVPMHPEPAAQFVANNDVPVEHM